LLHSAQNYQSRQEKSNQQALLLAQVNDIGFATLSAKHNGAFEGAKALTKLCPPQHRLIRLPEKDWLAVSGVRTFRAWFSH
jgi:hypothetical protein